MQFRVAQHTFEVVDKETQSKPKWVERRRIINTRFYLNYLRQVSRLGPEAVRQGRSISEEMKERLLEALQGVRWVDVL